MISLPKQQTYVTKSHLLHQKKEANYMKTNLNICGISFRVSLLNRGVSFTFVKKRSQTKCAVEELGSLSDRGSCVSKCEYYFIFIVCNIFDTMMR